MEKWHLLNASQMLAFLSFAGLMVCLWRLPRSQHPSHLAAFAFMLAGTLLREVAIYVWGAEVWGVLPLVVSGAARDIQIVGALLFVRAVTLPRCGEWVWIGVGIASAIFASLLP